MDFKALIRSWASRGDPIAAALKPFETPAWDDLYGDIAHEALIYEQFRDTNVMLYHMQHNLSANLSFVF